ncbi:hypothetical protein LX90_007003 [Lentzea flava]|nr:hypothetical protein [Lentzea flava]
MHARLLRVVLVEVRRLAVEGVHQTPQHPAHVVAMQYRGSHLAGFVPDLDDTLRVSHATGVEHVQLDVQAFRGLTRLEGQLPVLSSK